MKVLRYCRKSEADQDPNYGGQIFEINEYCKNNNLEVVGWIEEVYKGYSLNRPGLQEILMKRRLEDIKGIIVASVDRLSRNQKDLKYLLSLAEKEGFNWFFAREKISTQNKGSYQKIIHFGEFAQLESEQMSSRIKAALDANKAENKKTGGYVPYGYDCTEDGYKIPNEYQQKVIKLIIKLRDEDGLPWNKISSFLDKNNIPSKLGKLWSDTTVQRVYNDNINK